MTDILCVYIATWPSWSNTIPLCISDAGGWASELIIYLGIDSKCDSSVKEVRDRCVPV